MLNDLVPGVGNTAVDDVEVIVTVFGVTPFDDNGISIAVTCAQKINLVWQSTLLRAAT